MEQVRLVFLASCHSEDVGWAFHDAGVAHVICLKSSEMIRNDTQRIFTREFYVNIFSECQSVCKAFYNARETVRNH